MRRILTCVALASLGACATVSGTTGGLYQPQVLGDDTYSMSEMDMPLGGDVLTYAARFCADQGGRIQVEGDVDQRGVWTRTRYQRIIFTCGQRQP